MAGQKEYEVELQFSSGILSYPSRTNIDEENIDGEEPIFGSRMDLKSATPSSSRRGSRISTMGWVWSEARVASNEMHSYHNKRHRVPPHMLTQGTWYLGLFSRTEVIKYTLQEDKNSNPVPSCENNFEHKR